MNSTLDAEAVIQEYLSRNRWGDLPNKKWCAVIGFLFGAYTTLLVIMVCQALQA